MEVDNHQYVSPDVTINKFKVEIDHFNATKDSYRQKGIFLIDVSSLTAEFIFTVPKYIIHFISFRLPKL